MNLEVQKKLDLHIWFTGITQGVTLAPKHYRYCTQHNHPNRHYNRRRCNRRNRSLNSHRPVQSTPWHPSRDGPSQSVPSSWSKEDDHDAIDQGTDCGGDFCYRSSHDMEIIRYYSYRCFSTSSLGFSGRHLMRVEVAIIIRRRWNWWTNSWMPRNNKSNMMM